ncbi:MAG: site-specific integrase, partial [Acidimicrobiales bacterium]
FDNLSRGSPITARVYLRRFGAFCKRYETTPKALTRESAKELKNMLLDLVSDLSMEKKAGSYIQSNVKAVKSWFAFNDIEIKGDIKVEGAQDTPTLKEERVPTKDELKKILMSGDNKQRVACILIAHSGLRPESLGDYSGMDGLKVSDLPEMEVKDGVVSFKKIPTIVRVRNNISKAGHQYFSFLSEEGCLYVKDYLEERMRLGEKIDKESSIVTGKKQNRTKAHVSTTNIGDMIRVAIRTAGFRWRPYVLRSYFETQLMLADSKGLILRDYRTFFMGHKGDIENRYSTNKGRLPDEVIEDMRGSFKKASQFLETTKMEPSEEQMAHVKQQVEKDMAPSWRLNYLEDWLSGSVIKGLPPEKLYEIYKKERGISRDLTIEEKIEILQHERDRINGEIGQRLGVKETEVLGEHGTMKQLKEGSDRLRSKDKRTFLS